MSLSMIEMSLVFTIVVVVGAMHAPSAWGTEHSVSPGTSKIDCRSFGGGVSPGDTLSMAAGSRGPVSFENCFGSTSQPITIRNSASGKTIVNASGSYGLQCRNCEHVVLDGNGEWSGKPEKAYCGVDRQGTEGCGIKVAGNSAVWFVRIAGSSKDVTIQGIEVDSSRLSSGSGVCVMVNDHEYENWPAEWRENITIQRNYIHDCGGAGFYIGANWEQGGVDDLRLRNIEIAWNYVNGTGATGILLKTALEGDNSIHHNYVMNVDGLRAISIFEGTGKIYNNWVQNSKQHGINVATHHTASHFGPFEFEIFNNVVIQAGSAGDFKHGISISRTKTDIAQVRGTIYNNTVVGSAGDGINVASNVDEQGIAIRNNIVVGSAKRDLNANGANIGKNLTGTVASIGFQNPIDNDFRLLPSSPALDSVESSSFPSVDYRRVARPHGHSADIGAFEFTTSMGPRPPELL